ncbi:MAG: hypothetical protein ACTSYL_01925 [Candidatus Thorarchaeota archaeon]
MAIENEPGDATTGDERFAISAFEIASRTISLWLRRILEYIIVAGGLLLLYQLISTVVLMIASGSLISYIAFNGDILAVLNNLVSLTSSLTTFMVLVVIFSIGGMFVSAFVTGATIKLAYDDYGSPGNGSVGESFSFATSKVIKLIGINLLRGLIVGAFFIPTVFLMFIILSIPMTDPYLWMAQIQMYIGFLLLSLVILIIGIYVMIRLTPALAVGTIEDLGIVDSIKRAYRLSSHNFWHILGSMFLVVLGVALLGFIVLFVIGIFIPNLTLASTISGLVEVALFSAINMIYQTVLYRDLLAKSSVFEETYW